MPEKEFNIKDKPRDTRMRSAAVYIICVMVLILTILLDIYFISGILA